MIGRPRIDECSTRVHARRGSRMGRDGSRFRRLAWRKTCFSAQSSGAAVVMLLMLAAVAVLPAQAPQGGRGPARDRRSKKSANLKPNLYMVTGGGANTLVRVTPEGLIVVDTKNPSDENYKRLMEEIASVSKLPVKYVHQHASPSRSRRQQSEVHRRRRPGHRARCAEDTDGERPSNEGYSRAADDDVRQGLRAEARWRRGRGPLVRPWTHRRRHDGVLPGR